MAKTGTIGVTTENIFPVIKRYFNKIKRFGIFQKIDFKTLNISSLYHTKYDIIKNFKD